MCSCHLDSPREAKGETSEPSGGTARGHRDARPRTSVVGGVPCSGRYSCFLPSPSPAAAVGARRPARRPAARLRLRGLHHAPSTTSAVSTTGAPDQTSSSTTAPDEFAHPSPETLAHLGQVQHLQRLPRVPRPSEQRSGHPHRRLRAREAPHAGRNVRRLPQGARAPGDDDPPALDGGVLHLPPRRPWGSGSRHLLALSPARISTSCLPPTTRRSTTEDTRRSSRRSGTEECFACHPGNETTFCLKCHGLPIPHPAGWSPATGGNPGAHVDRAYAEPGICVKCHHNRVAPPAGCYGGECHGS